SASSFSFVLIDNYTLASVTQAPRANFIVAEDVHGLMVLNSVLGVRLLVSGFITTINAYDMGQGSVIMMNCTVADNPSSGSPIFWFANVAAVQIVLINVSCTGYFLFALFPTTTTIGTNSAKSVKIRIVNSSMRSIGRFLFFSVPNAYNGTVITRNVLSMSAEDSTFMLDGAVGLGAELLQFYSFANSALSSVPPALITVSILFSHCTVNATINSVKLLYTSPGSQSPLPTLHNSSIVFEDSVVYQTWETYVSYFGTVTPPVPLIQADLNKTSIVITRCNIFVQQTSSPIDPAVALLLSVSNSMTTSSLHFVNSSITVATNITSPLRTFPISINAMSSSNITVINTTLTNLLALVQLRNTSSPLNRNAIVDVGCSNSWCTPVDNRPCAPVALRYVLTTAPPPDVVVAVCSHSWSGSAAGYSVTSSSTQNTQPPSLSFSYSTSSTEPRGTASVANSATIAKDAVSLFLSMTASEIIKSSTVSVLLSVTANESINASPSVAASVSISTSRQNNSISSSTSPSTYNWSATESKLAPFIAVNDLLPPAAVQAFVVAAAAPLASVALSTSVAGVLQRNFIALRFSGCASSDTSEPNGDIDGHQRGQFMSVSENPTRLSFGVSAGAMYRGAAAGNMLLFAAACALIVPLGLVYSRCEKKDAGSAPRTLATSLGKLRLPGRAFVVPAVLLQPTVTAAAGLLMLSPLLAGDVVLSVVTMGVLVLLVGAPAWVVLRGCRVLVTAVDIPFRGGVVDYIAGRRVAWVPQSGLPLTGGGSWLLDRSVAGAECFALQFNSFICRVGSGA
ncbi:GPI-anchored surface protein, putative, partial [Bodo saltans]